LQTEDEKAGTSRSLKSNAVQLSFAGGKSGEPNRMQRAETLERGSLEWTDAAAVRSKLSGDKLAMDFGALGKARQLVATGAVQTEREMKGKPLQTASAANGLVEMGAAGDWRQMTLRGNVRLKEGERNAQAEQAVFARATQTAVLSGQAVVRDASSETHAAKFTFRQSSGDMEAEGNVRSTELAAKTSSLQLAAAPANISSEKMKGNSKTGRAVYSGHARLWQGASVMEAETIELQRDARTLIATGNVRAVFPQAESASKQAPGAAVAAKETETKLWHVAAGVLTYWDTENRACLEKNVFVQSTDQRMHSSALELFFTRDSTGKAGANSSSQISKAVGTGGVVVEEGERRGTADRGVYTATDQKFVLSGGTPTLYDGSEGSTTGRELTFYIADDTIIVDSGNGQRTLTRHRVQR